MRKFKTLYYNQNSTPSVFDKEILADIICDVCQKSCKTSNDIHFEHTESNFDFLHISGTFGFWSKHDDERWEGDICELCSVNYLEKIICFNKQNNISNYSEDDDLNQRANRIRKIRKINESLEFKIVDNELE